MQNNKKIYQLSDCEDENIRISLTEDQVKVFRWLILRGYEFELLEEGEVIEL